MRSHNTVSSYLTRLATVGLSWPLPADLGEVDLERRIYPPPPQPGELARKRGVPDWEHIHKELRRNPVVRDAFRFSLYTGMRLTEVVSLAWSQVDMATMAVRINDTKRALEFPVTRQLAAILERRFAEREQFAGEARVWVFPSETNASRHLESIQHLNARIGEGGGAKFWFHALRNCFITVADRELMLPTSLTKRPVKHAPSQDITEGYAADWTMAQLHHAAQRIAVMIDDLTLRAGLVEEAPAKTAYTSLAVSTTTFPWQVRPGKTYALTHICPRPITY